VFEDDVRKGGYTGPLTVGYDLFTIELTDAQGDARL